MKREMFGGRMGQVRRLREMLQQDMVVAPGAYDCITARAIELGGFGAVYMTGAGTSATLGYPDYGLVTLNEMAENAGRLANAVDIPVVADADTGYGTELNVVRTVREYERRGVAGLHIEDQVFPKKCGHLDNKQVVSLDEYIAKIRAAAAAKTNPDFLLIARTDARAVLGLDEAIRRANAALEAGADMAFVEAAQDVEEVRAIPTLVKGPCLLNLVWKGKTPLVPLADAKQMGYKMTILPGLLLRSVIATCEAMLRATRESGVYPAPGKDMSPSDVFAMFGAREWDSYRERFKVSNAAE